MPKRSKKDKQDAGTGVFANSPFKALKGLQKTVAGAAPPRAESPKPPSSSEAADDDALFLRAVDGARPVRADGEEQEDPSPPMRPPAAPSRSTSGDPDGRALFLEAMGSLGAAARPDHLDDDDAAPGHRRSASSRIRQLKRGTINISEELDLHGFLKDEALRRLGHFISSAQARGCAAVLVITGKGTNSPEGPVLPGAVDAWLREQGKGLVAEFHPAPRDKGGSGAYVVFLKRPGR